MIKNDRNVIIAEAPSLDNMVVLDLEWNQSSSGREPEIAQMPFEIIEIGAVRLDRDFDTVGQFSELICPRVYPKLYPITAKLIGLSMRELQLGDTFEAVWERFRNWSGSNPVFCTWGPTDITELQRNLRHFGCPLLREGPVFYLDVQKLYAIVFEHDIHQRKSLEKAVMALDLAEDEVPFHRAYTDAYYTAAVLRCIWREAPESLKFFSVDVEEPPRTEDDRLEISFGTYEKLITTTYPTREELLGSEFASRVACPDCGRQTKVLIPWFSGNGKQYLYLGQCREHGQIKGKLRMNHHGEQFFAVRTVRVVTENDASAVRKRHNKIKEQKLKHEAEAR